MRIKKSFNLFSNIPIVRKEDCHRSHHGRFNHRSEYWLAESLDLSVVTRKSVLLFLLVHYTLHQQGTIVEWTAAVGQAVKEGDVVALVETDKVTVDIKAEKNGVIVQQFGAV